MSWPTEMELARRFVASRLLKSIPTDTSEIAEIREAGIEEWHGVTGWRPFLSTGQSETISQRLPVSGLLTLPSGILSVSSISRNGEELAEGLPGYMLVGSKAPYRMIELYPPTEVTTIEVTGVFGYCIAIPSDVKEAFYAWCCAEQASRRPDSAAAIESTRTGDVSMTKNEAQVETWMKKWDKTWRRFARRGVFC